MIFFPPLFQIDISLDLHRTEESVFTAAEELFQFDKLDRQNGSIFVFLFQIMSEENGDAIKLDDDSLPSDGTDEKSLKAPDTQWINELRVALERGCDLGSIRTIGKCRALTDDLRLPVWKVRKKLKGTSRESSRCHFVDVSQHP